MTAEQKEFLIAKLDEAASHLDLRPVVVLVRRVTDLKWVHASLVDAIVLLVSEPAIRKLLSHWRIPQSELPDIDEVIKQWACKAATAAEYALDKSRRIDPSDAREESDEPHPANYEEIKAVVNQAREWDCSPEDAACILEVELDAVALAVAMDILDGLPPWGRQ